MAEYSKVGRKPIFCPSVGSFEQGMVVSVPLHYDQLYLEKYLASGKTGNKRRSNQFKVFSSIAQAH